METFVAILVFAVVVGFIVTKSRTARSKVHEWTKPKPPGTTKPK